MAVGDVLYKDSQVRRTAGLTQSRVLYLADADAGTPEEEPTENDPPAGEPDTPDDAQAGEAWRTVLTETVVARTEYPGGGAYYEDEILFPAQATPNPPNPSPIIVAQRLACYDTIGNASDPIDEWKLQGAYLGWQDVFPNLNYRYKVQSKYYTANIRKIISIGGYTSYSAMATAFGITTAQLFARMRALKMTSLSSAFSRQMRYKTAYNFPNARSNQAMGGWEVVIGANRLRIAGQTFSNGTRWIYYPTIDTGADIIANNNMLCYCHLSPFYYDPAAAEWASVDNRTVDDITYRVPNDPSLSWKVEVSPTYQLWC